MFSEELENQLNAHNIEQLLHGPFFRYYEIEIIDELIARVLNQAAKKLKGSAGMLYSPTKKFADKECCYFRKQK